VLFASNPQRLLPIPDAGFLHTIPAPRLSTVKNSTFVTTDIQHSPLHSKIELEKYESYDCGPLLDINEKAVRPHSFNCSTSTWIVHILRIRLARNRRRKSVVLELVTLYLSSHSNDEGAILNQKQNHSRLPWRSSSGGRARTCSQAGITPNHANRKQAEGPQVGVTAYSDVLRTRALQNLVGLEELSDQLSTQLFMERLIRGFKSL
jgi:hypothetical protein